MIKHCRHDALPYMIITTIKECFQHISPTYDCYRIFKLIYWQTLWPVNANSANTASCVKSREMQRNTASCRNTRDTELDDVSILRRIVTQGYAMAAAE